MSQQPGLVHDGMYRVAFVDLIEDISAPTIAELNAGMALECQITPDGLGREASDSTIDTGRLCSIFTTMRMGRTEFEVSLTLVRHDTSIVGVTDEAYDTLVKRKTGFLVIRDNKPGDAAWSATDEVEVYPVECGTRSKATPAANEQMTFTVPMSVTADPDLAAAVAAA